VMFADFTRVYCIRKLLYSTYFIRGSSSPFRGCMNFPRPMLNSPTGGNAAGNAFYRDVQRRVAASRESRKAVIEMAHVCERRNEPDYAEIIRQINICIAEIRPRLNMAGPTQMQARNKPAVSPPCVMCSLDRKNAFGDVALRRIANGSAVNERVAQGNSSQFNSLDFVPCGSGPGGRRFKSFRPDHLHCGTARRHRW
jgi:hypothetical protein